MRINQRSMTRVLAVLAFVLLSIFALEFPGDAFLARAADLTCGNLLMAWFLPGGSPTRSSSLYTPAARVIGDYVVSLL